MAPTGRRAKRANLGGDQGEQCSPWPNGQGVGLLIRRLRARVPQGVSLVGIAYDWNVAQPKRVCFDIFRGNCWATPRAATSADGFGYSAVSKKLNAQYKGRTIVRAAPWPAQLSKTLCPSGLRGWTQVPLARAAWVQIPQVSIFILVISCNCTKCSCCPVCFRCRPCASKT